MTGLRQPCHTPKSIMIADLTLNGRPQSKFCQELGKAFLKMWDCVIM